MNRDVDEEQAPEDEQENLLAQRDVDEEQAPEDEKKDGERLSAQREADDAVPDDDDDDEKTQVISAKPASAVAGRATTARSALRAAVKPTLATRIRAIRGGGHPLNESSRTFFEARLGKRFKQVRVHTDANANSLARAIHAKAFTVGHNIVFSSGRYEPTTRSGRRLLAHELVHVRQQTDRGGENSTQRTQLIQRVPRKTPHGKPYVKGIDHNHRPSGKWAKIRKRSILGCMATAGFNMIACVCAQSSPLGVLRAALKNWPLKGKPLAQKHLRHYISGSGKDFKENVSKFIKRDQGVRYKLASRAKQAKRGSFKVNQGDYKVQDYRYAFGAIDRLDYQVDRLRTKVHVWFADRYEFHPYYSFYKKKPGDQWRITNCVHAAAVEAQLAGAKAYWMYSYGTIPYSTVSGTGKPSGGGGIF